MVYKRCFFHYLKNIRKYLVKNGFGKKSSENYYNYIIKSCYKLLFKKIHKNIEKELKNYLERIKHEMNSKSISKNNGLNILKIKVYV